MTLLKAFLENWAQNILRPLVVNVLTAVILFFLAVSFKPLIFAFFRGSDIPEYPLICTAEPYRGVVEKEMMIDFFVINRIGESRTREQLIVDLKALNPEPKDHNHRRRDRAARDSESCHSCVEAALCEPRSQQRCERTSP
jgi:hypothetical protein